MFRFFENLVNPEMRAQTAPPKTMWAFFKWALKGSWPIVLIAFAFSMLGGGMEAFMGYLLGQLVDLAAVANPVTLWQEHWKLVFAFFLFAVILRPIVFAISSAFQSLSLGPNLFNLVLGRINRYTLGHPVTFFDDDFAGRIAQKEMQTTRAMVDVVLELINAIAFALASVIGTALVFATISWTLIVVIVIWLFFYIGFLYIFLPRLRVRSAHRASARAMVTGQIVDTMTNIKTVKLFAGAGREDSAAARAMLDFRASGFYWARLAVMFRLGLMFIAGTLPLAMLIMGLTLWQRGAATPGDLAAIGALSIRISHMTGWVSWTLMGIFGNLGEIEDGVKTLSPDYALQDHENATVLMVDQADIVFDDVNFMYGGKIGGISDLSLNVKAGEKLGLVGASGAGKSTLVALALRLYDPETGTIRVSGTDVSEVTQDSLRQQISMVTQETAMFNRSARDNIMYGNPNASDEQLMAAAQKAEAHDFILDLVDNKGRTGYDAHLGERGVKLSGGQRQRIALARAILKDAPILLLDEATSALDSKVEVLIQSALERVMEGKTVIAIAHRLSTIAKMDRIVVLDKGRIVEQGTHDELIANESFYAELWGHQTGEFLDI